MTNKAYFREIFTSMSTTGLLAGGGSSDGLDGALEEVAELKSLDEVTGNKTVL